MSPTPAHGRPSNAVADRRRPLVVLSVALSVLIASSSLAMPVTAAPQEAQDEQPAATAVGLEISRLAGGDRYATAARISAGTFAPGVKVAFVATGVDFPDALAGGAAAAHAGGPVLLVTRTGVPASTGAELDRLDPGRIVVLGGPSVIADHVVDGLRAYATSGTVQRLAGRDRFETAARVSAAHFGSGINVAYVATGRNFPDALGGGAAAARAHAPVLLVTESSVPAATRAELARLKPQRIVVLGSTGVVSPAVAAALRGYATSGQVTRLAGPDRFATAAAISAATFVSGASVAYVATGTSFPDGLAAAPLAARTKAPILLTSATSLPGATAAELRRLSPDHVIILGSTRAVADRVLSQIRHAASSAVVGYGAATVGGDGGTTIEVRNVAELARAFAADGPRTVRLIGSGAWDANGQQLTINRPYITVDGSACNCYIRDGWISVRASQVILRDLRIRTGDESVDAQDADPISISGGSSAIRNVVVDHVEAIWGPDVGGITILNNVSDVTVQHSIIGEGLFRSRHPEANEDADGHSYALNISGLSPTAAPQRITIYRNLITTSENRNPRVCGAAAVDLVNNVIYNHREGPQCNPRSLNVVGNVLVKGPAPAAAGLAFETAIFRHKTSADYPTPFPGSVYISGNAGVGFGLTGYEGPSGVVRSGPATALSVAPSSITGLLDAVLATVGPSQRDGETLRIIRNVWDRTGRYVSGSGVYPPR